MLLAYSVAWETQVANSTQPSRGIVAARSLVDCDIGMGYATEAPRCYQELCVVIRLSVFLSLVLTASTRASAEQVIPIPNGDFERELDGWTIPRNEGISALASERKAGGEYSLRIVDRSDKDGSNVTSTRVAVPGGGLYQLRGKIFAVFGQGLGMYLRVYDKEGKAIAPGDRYVFALGGGDKKWRDFQREFYLPDEIAFLELWIHSYAAAQVEAYLDDLCFVYRDISSIEPPWEAQYKLKPDGKSRLTAADVVGPDGIVYPDWRYAGVQGGIPRIVQKATIEQFGGKADDNVDDSDSLRRACEVVGRQGGGAVVLGKGTYDLDLPVTIKHPGVVIRGQGRDETRVIFRYDIPEPGAAFYGITNDTVGNNTIIQLHCRPTDLMTMRIECDGKTMATWSRSTHSGNTYSTWMYGRKIYQTLGPGKHTLVGTGTYRDGRTVSCERSILADPNYTEPAAASSTIDGAIAFTGGGYAGARVTLSEDGKRGDTVLTLTHPSTVRRGDYIVLDAPATERWNQLTGNACQWGSYRRYVYRIDAAAGNRIRVNQPLRIDFPVIDGAYIQPVHMIEGCGIEDLYIEQTANLWITTVMFRDAANCWARGVKVKNCGRHAIYGSNAKWCEIRDCVFEDAWFKGGGGTAYAGWERCWDCLMEGVETFRLRHAPLFQWSASGNVIRKSVFHDSDGQWHAGWTNENLIEQCTITSRRGHGGYGYGLWASPPEDAAHGPNGPRNVVYHCDIFSQRAGLWMGGMNENWLILHNRFRVESGAGVFGKTCSFDHIIRDNVFVLEDRQSPMVTFATPDCMGVELIDNHVYGGSGKILGGHAPPAVNQGNRSFPLGDAARPQPAVPSIFQWQRDLPK